MCQTRCTPNGRSASTGTWRAGGGIHGARQPPERARLSAAIAAFGEKSRRIQSRIIARVLKDQQVDTKALPPIVLAFILECMARSLVMESNLGQDSGHKSVLAFVKRFTARSSQPE